MSSSNSQTAASRAGFTLIEMLVTVSIFGVALAALLACLRVGTDSTERVETRLAAEREQAVGLQRMEDDLFTACLESDNRELHFGAEAGEALLEFFRLASDRESRDGLPAHLEQVTYIVEENAAGGQRLVRRSTPVIADAPLGEDAGRTREEVILRNVSGTAVQFYDGNDWKNDWSAGRQPSARQRLPRAVRVEGRLDGAAGPFRLTVALPASEFFGD